MKSKLLILCLLYLGISALQAGEYGDAFLLASQYPHAQSLGFSSVAGSVSSGHAMNNPAGFAQNSIPKLNIVYEQFTGLTSNIGAEGTLIAGSSYAIGITILHNSIDDLYSRPNLSGMTPLARRDSVLSLSLSAGELINYREDAIFLSVAREYAFALNLGWKFFKIPVRMPLGLSLKYLDKVLVENRGIGSGIDFGGQFFFNLGGMSEFLEHTEFGLGLLLSDILNTPVYWTTEHQDAIKRGLVTGYSVSQNLVKYSSRLSFTSSNQSRYKNVNQYGFEISLRDAVYLRAGHDGYTTSFGLGISLKKFIIDYSFSQHELANMQKIGINYKF
ncbi:MAG: hypothetical protein HQ508_06855 [Candidatus Marinimicrobia bacterium]|nr:hypothetical protein [Candidatus Neomarinimicrobiota bacterium]